MVKSKFGAVEKNPNGIFNGSIGLGTGSTEELNEFAGLFLAWFSGKDRKEEFFDLGFGRIL